MQMNETDAALPKILGGDVGRQFSFSQSIFPGQKYKAIFRSVTYTLYIESLKEIKDDGNVDFPSASNCNIFENDMPVEEVPSEYQSFLKKIW